MANKSRARMPLPGRPDEPSQPAPPPLPARRAPPAIPQPVHVTKLNTAEESDEDDSYEEPSNAKLNEEPDGELYDSFEEDDGPPVSPYNPTRAAPEIQQDIYDDFEEESQDVYEEADQQPSGPEVKNISPIPPPLPPMDNRRRGSQPPLPPVPNSSKRDLPPPPTPEPSDIYEDPGEDSETPPAPPLPSGRLPKPPTPKRKTEDKPKPVVPTNALGPIGQGDILGALKGLKKISRDDKTEDKNNNEKKNNKDALPFQVQLRKTSLEEKAKEPKESGNVISGLKDKLNKINKGTSDTDKTVMSPTQEKKGTPILPSHPENEEKSLPPPPSPEDFPPPPPADEFDYDDGEIYDDASSQDLDPLAKFSWYHGKLERKQSERMLKNIGKDGTFLVRKSTQGIDQPYTMAVLYQDRVNNLKVRLRDDGRIALGEAKANEISFKDVEGMVEHHKKHPVLLIGKQQGEITLQDSPRKV